MWSMGVVAGALDPDLTYVMAHRAGFAPPALVPGQTEA